MRTKCPKCREITSHVRGCYEITATSDLVFVNVDEEVRPAVAPLNLTRQSFVVSEVTCPHCGYTGPIEEWSIIFFCVACGETLAEKRAGLDISAEDLYCTRECGFICKSCALRHGTCDTCRRRSTCPIITSQEV